MRIATQTPQQSLPALAAGAETDDTVDTLLWIEEHDWLYALLKSGLNVSPKFRMPDLISACAARGLAPHRRYFLTRSVANCESG